MPFDTITHQMMVCVGCGKKRCQATDKGILGVGFASEAMKYNAVFTALAL